MAKQCECGGYFVNEINIWGEYNTYLGNGWELKTVYPTTEPTVRYICCQCKKKGNRNEDDKN